jgi:hypothetical protein
MQLAFTEELGQIPLRHIRIAPKLAQLVHVFTVPSSSSQSDLRNSRPVITDNLVAGQANTQT